LAEVPPGSDAGFFLLPQRPKFLSFYAEITEITHWNKIGDFTRSFQNEKKGGKFR
jgi:hypothetical protein